MKRKNQSKWLNPALVAAGLAVASSLAATSAEAASFSLFYDPTNGVTVSANGPTGTGVTGQADFAFSGSGTLYTLDLTLTNTSVSPITASELVAYGFNVPNLVTGATYNPLSSTFTRLFSSSSSLSLIETGGDGEIESPAQLSGLGGNHDFDLGIRVVAAEGNPNAGTFNGGPTVNGLNNMNNTDSTTTQFLLTTQSTTLADLELAFLTTLTDTTIFNSGLRYQAIAGGAGSSDKLFNGFNPPPPPGPGVPEPMTILGTGMALGLGTLFQKQRSKQKKQGLKA